VASHYFFPPASAYPLNRFLFALKSDDGVRARYLSDPEAMLREASLDGEAAAALRDLDRDRLVRCGAHPYLVFMAGLRLRMSRDSSSFERF
jgi:Aromatic-ring-opening dioxygenase LigAB, LigA subunit